MFPAALAVAISISITTAAAAELRWLAPRECPSGEQLEREIEAQIGRPLAEVTAVDFDAVVERAAEGRFELTLRTLPRSTALAPNARQIAAASCQELGGALVVAVAMALGEHEASPPAPAAAAAPREQSTPARTRRSPAALRYGMGLAATLDVGALPELGLGGELQGTFGVRALRLVALGALFQAQDAPTMEGAGAGEIRLAFAGLLACGELRRGAFGWLGCGGYELGKMWGRGTGIMQPDAGSALWSALRGEVGLDIALAPHVALMTRLAAVVPLGRPEFDIEDALIHKPSPASFRALLGLAFSWPSSNRSDPVRRLSEE